MGVSLDADLPVKYSSSCLELGKDVAFCRAKESASSRKSGISAKMGAKMGGWIHLPNASTSEPMQVGRASNFISAVHEVRADDRWSAVWTNKNAY